MVKWLKYVFFFLLVFLATACEEVILGPQPKILQEDEFEPYLNILGIIRPDSSGDYPMSFVHVEKSLPATNESWESWDVKDASVWIYRKKTGEIYDSLPFVYTETNDPMLKDEYRPESINVEEGDCFELVCSYPGFPVLHSTTIVPNIPEINKSSVDITEEYCSFSISRDTTAYLYDIYLVHEKETIYSRVSPHVNKTNVTLDIKDLDLNAGADLIIYAYDQNLATYYGATNVFIKPNTYRPPFSTVNNGYGCFGSLNILIVKL